MYTARNYIFFTITFIFTLISHLGYPQGLFNSIYPVGENPNIGWKSSLRKDEKILFEANPILRMPLYNNIISNFKNNQPCASTVYLAYRPQLRMYADNSKPVKTPSYRLSLGGQFLHRFDAKDNDKKSRILTLSIESGHYSNGQSQCAFDKDIPDGSAECDSVYRTITSKTNLSEKLNRESGNFSTNFTEIILNYRWNWLKNYIPTQVVSIKAGITRYHNNLLYMVNIGGYTRDDIKIYGKNRYLFGLELTRTNKLFSADENKSCCLLRKISRYSVAINYEFIDTPHSSVNPHRFELISQFFFKNNMGIILGGAFGHDNYNYRFVDSGKQYFIGITFDIFPPMEIRGASI